MLLILAGMSESCCFTKTLLVSVMLASVSVVSGSIQDKLFYFETLKAKDVEVITKRSIDTDPSSHLTLVHLQGLGRNFNFYLHSSHRLLTRDFSVSTVNGTGHKTPLLINKSAFYEGALLDDKESHVDAVWEEDNLLATITTPEDTYIVEPSWRHLPSSSNHSMIIYKGSDMKSSNYSISHHSHHSCGHKSGVAHPKEEFGKWQSKLYKESGYNESVPFSHSHSNNNHRPRRKSNVEKKTCELMIIADYRYFVAIGRGSSVATVNYMVHTISKVDMIFRATVWDDDDKGILKNMGLKIKKAVVYKEYSPKGHYNSKTNLEYDKLLTAFSVYHRDNKNCLVHLFTHKAFNGGIIGYAYIAPSHVRYQGGICSSPYYIPDAIFSFNTGLTTTSHSDGSPVLTLRSQLVTGHEIGHNWGSGHDLETVECSPSSADGGNYIMNSYSVTGSQKNNQIFSSCSKREIKQVLQIRSHLCFKENIEYSYCGNSRVDTYAAEECDEGMLEGPAVGLCCDKYCLFKGNAKCSPYNEECCSLNCTVAPKGTRCRTVAENSSFCLKNTSCNGIDYNCPKEFQEDNTTCLDDGICINGMCTPFCEARNKTTCVCDKLSETCLRCCVGEDNVCKPYDGIAKYPDGRPCNRGLCALGTCFIITRDTFQRMFDIFEHASINGFVEFMKTNIVSTVILFSLMLWIPTCFIITYSDRKHRQNLSESQELEPVNMDSKGNQDTLEGKEFALSELTSESMTETERSPSN